MDNVSSHSKPTLCQGWASGVNHVTELFPILGPTSCDDCGYCCLGIGSPVVIYARRPGFDGPHPYRPADLPPELAAEIDEHFSGLVRGQEPQETCLWHDPVTRRCKHHEFRPQVCRDYEIGARACLTVRKQHGFRDGGA